MICPQCKAEYRQGFTECSDCHVPLVASLPEIEEADSKTMSGASVEPLWEGENLALHTSLLAELAAAGIRYFTEPMGIYPGVRRGDPFPIQPMTRFGYQVAVLVSDLAAARRIVEKLINEEPQDLELPVRPEETVAAAETTPSEDEEPTFEIWAGQDEALSGFLGDALRENEILLRTEVADGENKVLVRLSDARRAKDIVREIVEGAPPE
jgi:hypothetical protein